MARIRSIKPEFWKHEQLGRLSMGARLTYIGLWNMADDAGRGRADPELLWGELHSGQRPNTKRGWLDILSELRRVTDDKGHLIIFYKVAGAAYYWIPGFCRQQRIDKPQPSRLPPPTNSKNVLRTIQDHSTLERRGEEGRGLEQGEGGGEDVVGAPAPAKEPSDVGRDDGLTPTGEEALRQVMLRREKLCIPSKPETFRSYVRAWIKRSGDGGARKVLELFSGEDTAGMDVLTINDRWFGQKKNEKLSLHEEILAKFRSEGKI